jgi:hypothetical protein
MRQPLTLPLASVKSSLGHVLDYSETIYHIAKCKLKNWEEEGETLKKGVNIQIFAMAKHT